MDEHNSGIKRMVKNDDLVVTYADESAEVLIRDINNLQITAKIAKEKIGGVNPRDGSIFLNEIGAMGLTENMLITGESKKVRLWDLRQALTNPV